MQDAVRSSEEMSEIIVPWRTNTHVRGARYKLSSRHNNEEGASVVHNVWISFERIQSGDGADSERGFI